MGKSGNGLVLRGIRGHIVGPGILYKVSLLGASQSVARPFSISAPALFNLICFNFHPIERTEQHQSAGIDGVQWRLTRKTINQK